jgi:hypothetical protein
MGVNIKDANIKDANINRWRWRRRRRETIIGAAGSGAPHVEWI